MKDSLGVNDADDVVKRDGAEAPQTIEHEKFCDDAISSIFQIIGHYEKKLGLEQLSKGFRCEEKKEKKKPLFQISLCEQRSNGS